MVRLILHHFKGWDTTAIVVNGDREASEWLQQHAREAARLAAEEIRYSMCSARRVSMAWI